VMISDGHFIVCQGENTITFAKPGSPSLRYHKRVRRPGTLNTDPRIAIDFVKKGL
jgi:hypothetical protein